ncbi:KH domain-containing protein [Paenibacillus thermoaerophilus]|jgi:predicted RNA-binding protein YlqC (UPF0109 family)|uniref:RNA-binding protein KhpA n=1 Tax=Paenibacillus thermoaerophilus TaxID=1215385 RepID=A0ABW2UY47_9BACL|nr:KH domain-containing protein [Paenibacillus thermoaerophilus]TMV19192.1 KH domain-containing protein [Paenibacillus thermoaerophilus]
MKELITVIARRLVDHPDDVSVAVEEREDSVVYKLQVHPSDVGKVIGKQGRIAKSLRTVVTSAAARENKRVFVDIVD